LTRMVGFRNVPVHGYQDMDKAVVRDVVKNGLEDLDIYVTAWLRPDFSARATSGYSRVQRLAAASSAIRESSQCPAWSVNSFFQKGARVFR